MNPNYDYHSALERIIDYSLSVPKDYKAKIRQAFEDAMKNIQWYESDSTDTTGSNEYGDVYCTLWFHGGVTVRIYNPIGYIEIAVDEDVRQPGQLTLQWKPVPL